ncbi:MAG: hypothetical protein IH795_10055, partial [Bacteroidetes bacterium]|nr:hypothetical protein [Bacteroidota bacterium]
MMANIWVYIDQFRGQPLPASFEALTVARKIADQSSGTVNALIMGDGIADIATLAAHYHHDAANFGELLSDTRANYLYILEKLGSIKFRHGREDLRGRARGARKAGSAIVAHERFRAYRPGTDTRSNPLQSGPTMGERREVSAGGVVFRRVEGEIEV